MGFERVVHRLRTVPATHFVMGALALAYAVFLSFLAIEAHHGLKTVMNDLGNTDQALWGAAHGRLAMPQSNDVDETIRSRFGIHANFIFVPLSLLYRIHARPEVLL